MTYVDVLAEMIKDGIDGLWRGVHAMPVDKLDWRPAPDARTTRELLEELASATKFSADLVRAMKMPEMGESEMPKDMSELEKLHRANMDDFIAAIREFPEDKLHDVLEMPWGKTSFLQSISYPYWNMMYHWGQISYIQTMYGDKETH